jgi:hypothetical protein
VKYKAGRDSHHVPTHDGATRVRAPFVSRGTYIGCPKGCLLSYVLNHESQNECNAKVL